MLSIVMLLNWLGKKRQDEKLISLAKTIETAILTALEKRETTPDLGGTESTDTFSKVVIRHLKIN